MWTLRYSSPAWQSSGCHHWLVRPPVIPSVRRPHLPAHTSPFRGLVRTSISGADYDGMAGSPWPLSRLFDSVPGRYLGLLSILFLLYVVPDHHVVVDPDAGHVELWQLWFCCGGYMSILLVTLVLATKPWECAVMRNHPILANFVV